MIILGYRDLAADATEHATVWLKPFGSIVDRSCLVAKGRVTRSPRAFRAPTGRILAPFGVREDLSRPPQANPRSGELPVEQLCRWDRQFLRRHTTSVRRSFPATSARITQTPFLKRSGRV